MGTGWVHSRHFIFTAYVDEVDIGVICEFWHVPRETLVCLQEVKFHNSFNIIICAFENIPKETNVDAGKILGGEKKNNTPNSDQFYFNRLSWLPAGHRADYL